jgi:holo-[acyl-carrier protein] synthase
MDNMPMSLSLSVGIDLASVSAVARTLDAHSERYLERVYTATERHECTGATGLPDPARLAARFAAKEATRKALRAGDEPLPWTSIGVRSESSGAPSLELTGRALELARLRQLDELHVSLTHEGPFAAAVVVAIGGH